MIGAKFFIGSVLLVIVASLSLSCGTMAAAETARQARVAAQRAEQRANKNTSTTLASQTGALLQRVDPNAVKVDEKTVQLGQSVASAQTHLANNDLTSSNIIAPGPLKPFLKPVLNTVADLQLTVAQYIAYVKAVSDVFVSLQAHGLAKNIAGINQVRTIWPIWRAYFGQLNVDNDLSQIAEKDLKEFYINLGFSQKAADKVVDGINKFVDRQRTRPYSPSLSQTSN